LIGTAEFIFSFRKGPESLTFPVGSRDQQEHLGTEYVDFATGFKFPPRWSFAWIRQST